MEELTRSSLKGFLNRTLFAYKNGRFASSFSLLRYRTFLSLEKGKFVFQKSLSETPSKPDRVSFCTLNSCRMERVAPVALAGLLLMALILPYLVVFSVLFLVLPFEAIGIPLASASLFLVPSVCLPFFDVISISFRYMRVYIHIYISTYIHTYIYIYMHACCRVNKWSTFYPLSGH